MAAADRSGVLGFGNRSHLEDPVESEPFTAIGGLAKRMFDVTAASLILIMLAPLFIMTAAVILATSGGPVLFGHRRVGLGGRTFRCWKFRTMRTDAAEALQRHLDANPEARAEWQARRKLKDDPRITAFGRVLREYSVDELPQLLNVILGDMSLVGPRPVVDEEIDYYGSEAQTYFAARPGITGLWQVSGRSETDYARRVELDAKYVRSWSHSRDMGILLRTVPAVLGARGSY